MPSRTKLGTSKRASQERRAQFCEAYIANGGNATRAYMETYACKNVGTASTEGHRLLKDPQVAAAIEARRSEIRAQYQLTTERVIQEIARVAYYNPKRLVDEEGKPKSLHELDDDTAAALAAVEIEVRDGVTVWRTRPHSKNEALAKAMKILRLEDAPPPPPNDTGTVDSRETAKWLAFILNRGVKKLPSS